VNQTTKAIAAVAIIVAAVVLYLVRAGGATNDITSRTDFNAMLKCRACSAEFKATLSVEDEPPYKCEKCGKREAWKLAKCNACGHVFLPEISGDPPRPPIAPTCPKCNKQETGAATP
jgi:DNA-directed RNA polymerase subunit RPC12/RpoP